MSTPLPNLAIDGPLQQAQRAISARLREFFPAARFQHHIVPARMTPSQLDQISKRAPALGVGWLGWVPNESNGRVFRGRADFAVFLLAKQAQAEVQLQGRNLASGTYDPGILGMVQVAVAALQGFRVTDGDGNTIGSAAVTGCGHVFSDEWARDDYAIAGLTVCVPHLSSADPSAISDLADFLRLHADWNDGAATDDLTLQTGSTP